MRPHAFNLIVVHGDGTRIRRLDFPRWALVGGVAFVVLTVSTALALFFAWRGVRHDYLTLKRESAEVFALRQRADEQHALLDTVRRRVKDIHGEVATWRELHSRIAGALGPAHGAPAPSTGVGGVGRPLDTPTTLGAELDRLYTHVSEEGQRLQALDRFMARASKLLAAIPTRWPVRGHVNSEYGRRTSPWNGDAEFHSGLDIAAAAGTPVVAPAAGVVSYAGPGGDYGNTVILDHGNDLTTLFGHLQRVDVTKGQKVHRGQQIALTGNTGRSTGPHLHYEVQVRKQAVNPRGYIWN